MTGSNADQPQPPAEGDPDKPRYRPPDAGPGVATLGDLIELEEDPDLTTAALLARKHENRGMAAPTAAEADAFAESVREGKARGAKLAAQMARSFTISPAITERLNDLSKLARAAYTPAVPLAPRPQLTAAPSAEIMTLHAVRDLHEVQMETAEVLKQMHTAALTGAVEQKKSTRVNTWLAAIAAVSGVLAVVVGIVIPFVT